jgi:hypothetical protein
MTSLLRFAFAATPSERRSAGPHAIILAIILAHSIDGAVTAVDKA